MPNEEITNPEEYIKKILDEGKKNRRKEKIDWSAFINKWLNPFIILLLGIMMGKVLFSDTKYILQPPRSIPNHYSVQYEDSIFAITTIIDTAYYSEKPYLLPGDQ
jgi:hypothetical protein